MKFSSKYGRLSKEDLKKEIEPLVLAKSLFESQEECLLVELFGIFGPSVNLCEQKTPVCWVKSSYFSWKLPTETSIEEIQLFVLVEESVCLLEDNNYFSNFRV